MCQASVSNLISKLPASRSEIPQALLQYSLSFTPPTLRSFARAAMRIFLLPVSNRRTLLYCSKSTIAVPSAPGIAPARPSIPDRIVARANATWADWEQAPSGWKKTLTDYGNRAFSRIAFEEWGLKTLPAAHAAALESIKTTPVVYPGRFLAEGEVLTTLRRLAQERQGLHKQRLWWSIVGMPLSAPFALIPIVPNIPFFYLAFRAWSHYKALYGAKYLAVLLEKKLVAPEASAELDGLVASGTAEKDQADVEQAAEDVDRRHDAGEETMLLSARTGRLIAEQFKLPAMQIEIERAVEQVQRALVKAEEERRTKEATKKQQ